MHENNIAHQDIKDENVIINEQFHIKLIDFGRKIGFDLLFVRVDTIIFRLGNFDYETRYVHE